MLMDYGEMIEFGDRIKMYDFVPMNIYKRRFFYAI